MTTTEDTSTPAPPTGWRYSGPDVGAWLHETTRTVVEDVSDGSHAWLGLGPEHGATVTLHFPSLDALEGWLARTAAKVDTASRERDGQTTEQVDALDIKLGDRVIFGALRCVHRVGLIIHDTGARTVEYSLTSERGHRSIETVPDTSTVTRVVDRLAEATIPEAVSV